MGNNKNGIDNYCEMIYGLFYSRGLKDGYREWGISKDRVKNYIEFHLGKSCNPIKLSLALNYFDYYSNSYHLPTKSAGQHKGYPKSPSQ